jgi:preprotein translocase subunit SecF
LTVLALWLFGGPVLNAFSFALVVGIIIGTYSSVFIASPIVLGWQNYSESRKRGTSAPAPRAAAPVASKPSEKTLARKAK